MGQKGLPLLMGARAPLGSREEELVLRTNGESIDPARGVTQGLQPRQKLSSELKLFHAVELSVTGEPHLRPLKAGSEPEFAMSLTQRVEKRHSHPINRNFWPNNGFSSDGFHPNRSPGTDPGQEWLFAPL